MIYKGYHKLNLYNYLIGYHMNYGLNYTQAKKLAIKDYLKLLGVKNKTV